SDRGAAGPDLDVHPPEARRQSRVQPVWDGKAFQPKLMLPLSLSYDHRVINGAAAARFTKRLSDLLGDIRTILL
ncbi:2-oxo acid dehydrogenase subunit E2, partial [Pseudomonas fluorescens]|uniref:2-oxo acid dehydrogenase subunit E2 n=1 Tax=Pseudomonas fluorescens TaxID=294 RepID=UPI003CFF1D89